MKANNTSTKIGLIILVVSISILGLLLFFKLQTDRQMLAACTQACGETGGEARDGTSIASCNLNSCPYHQNNNLSWILLTISILVTFLGSTGIYLSLSNRVEKNVEEKEYNLTPLSDDEKKMFMFIKDHQEGVYQSHISKEFNLSKVQGTRLMDKFEGLELIERKRRGLANLVQVK